MSPHAPPLRGSLPPEGARIQLGSGPALSSVSPHVSPPRGAMRAWVHGVGVIAPGLPDWPTAAAVLRGELVHVPAPSVLPVPELLPGAERRRASRIVKVTLGVGLQAVQHAGADAATLTTVFSASGADGHNCHALCEQLAGSDRQISPTRFHNSVHNAAAGYWGIATHSMAPSQVIAAHDASLGAGLLDALAQVMVDGQPVLLVASDGEYPQPLHALRPISDCAGVALLLSPHADGALGALTLQPVEAQAEAMELPSLEALRREIPALRSLPLLQRIARAEAGPVVLDYLAPMQLAVDWQPC